MRLHSLETFLVSNPPPSFGGRYFMFVKLTTDDNIVGYGEIYAGSISPKIQLQVAEDLFERYFLDRSPFDIERLFSLCHSSGYSQRPDPTIMGAFSGLEIACWDIVGKSLGVPIHQLLGGCVYDRLRAYTYLYPGPSDDPADFYNDPEKSAACALKYVERGFTAIKFDPAGPYTIYDPHQPAMIDLDRCERFCRIIRESIGTRADILFGTHGQFTPSAAIRLARRLESYDPLWFEEPVPPEMPEEMARVASSCKIPIATGERLTTKYEFSRVLRYGAASILQPALGRVGGIWEAKKIAALAEVHYAQIAPHLYCGPLEALANIQFASSIPNFLLLESIGYMDGFHSDLLTCPFVFDDGYIVVSREPGLGSDLNEDFARSHIYDGEELHLQMQEVSYNYSSENRFAGG